MTAPRPTFLLLLVAACLALLAGPAFAEPVETPPAAPPAGAADEVLDGPPPAAPDEMAPTGELPAVEAEPVVETMQALPGRLPSTDGPKIPNVIGRVPRETNQALSAWRLRLEHVVTDRSFVGRVVDQHPDAGSTLAPGEVVTLVVGIPTLPSRGHTCVPRIETLTLEAAVAALRKQGFDIMLRTAESYDGDKGIVLAQAPRPASVAPRGSRVILVVGKGGLAEPVVVAEPLPAPTEDVPPATDDVESPAMPAGPPPGAEPPVVEEPPTPTMPEPPAEAPPTPPAEEPAAVEPPMPPTEEPPVPPMPPTEEPTPPPAPVVEEPIAPPQPKVVLRVPTLAGPPAAESYPRAFGATFTWGKISGAKTYEWELQVEAKDGTWSTVTTETVEGTSHRPKRMEAGHLRWRVRALADDAEGAWSEFRELYLY